MAKIKRIAVLTSGGDAQGMNAAVYSVVRYGLAKGLEVYGIRGGYAGLLKGNFVKMSAIDVDDIIHRGGSMLKTSRCPEMKTEEGQKQAYDNLKANQIDGLVVIGGDGSFQGAKALATKYGMLTVGIPGTIDNDLAYTDYTLGFDSAVNAVMNTITDLRDTMSANNRTCVVEVMGRNCGDIALYAGITSAAEIICVPEIRFSIKEVVERLQHNIEQGKMDNIIVLAEGAGKAENMVKDIKQLMPDISIRSMVVGHLQRGGDASFSDRLLGVRMGRMAVKSLIEGRSSCVVGVRDSEIIVEDIVVALSKRKSFDVALYELSTKLVRTY